jgi:hypothetical protein
VLLDVCRLIANHDRWNGRPMPFATEQHRALCDALLENRGSAVAPTMVAVFRQMGMVVRAEGEEQQDQPVSITYHYWGGLPYVLIGNWKLRLIHGVMPKDACGILAAVVQVAQLTTPLSAQSKLWGLAQKHSHP